ncbi:MAG: erythromycin esterase family protein, partial [Planctomycetota bacterium]
TRLLLQQARSAIQIDQTRIEQWTSLEMRKELELYARIREKQTRVETWARGLRGEAATTFTQFVRAAKDVQKCQRQFRTELTHAQRQAWRKSVQWALKQADDDIQSAVQDLQQFLAITTESLEKPNELVNVRDETMAGLVESILEQHGEEARIMLWAHDWHISKFAGDPASDVPRMGTYLEQRRGTDYLPVGLSFGSGTFQAKYSPKPDEDPAKLVLREFRVDGSREDSFSNVFDHCDAPLAAFVLSGQPLEALPPWMKLPHPNRTIGAVYRPSLGRTDAYYEDVVLDRHFELVFHVPETTRAKPLHPVARFRFGAQFDEPPESQQRSGQQAHVTVKSVSPKSLAEKCGLRVGDQIVEFEGKEIAGKVDFESALAGVERPGSHALRVRREGDPVEGPAERQELILYLVVPAWIAESWPDGRSPFER